MQRVKRLEMQPRRCDSSLELFRHLPQLSIRSLFPRHHTELGYIAGYYFTFYKVNSQSALTCSKTIQKNPRKYPFRPTVRFFDSTSRSAHQLAIQQMAARSTRLSMLPIANLLPSLHNDNILPKRSRATCWR